MFTIWIDRHLFKTENNNVSSKETKILIMINDYKLRFA